MSKKLSKSTKRKLEKLLLNTGDVALKRRAIKIVRYLNPRKGDRILDMGCGDGYYLYLLSNLGINLKLIGADPDKNAICSARKNLQDKNVRLIDADLMNKTPFKKNYFDKVLMSEVLEHLPNDIKGLKEISRILNAGGTLVLSVPNANYPFLWDPVNWMVERLLGVHIKQGFWAGIWNQHERLYTVDEIKSTVQEAGFKILNTESLTYWSLPFNHHIINLGARILSKKRGTGSDLIKGADKFTSDEDKGFISSVYFNLTNMVDKMNDISPSKKKGVSIVLKASN